MRLGLFGGTFDPIHLAHLILADWVREEEKLDRVLFVPADTPPHKVHRTLSPPWQRLAMVRLATADCPFFEVPDLEIRRGGVSYTIDTVLAVRELYGLGSDQLFLIAGSDSLHEMDSWREPERIFAECRVVVVRRPGFDPAEAPPQFAAKAKLSKAPLVEISSSQIRERVRAGKSIRYLVPAGVERFIVEHGLYRVAGGTDRP
ncbi:MAG: nicotinate-nucleotide adenylyltransferase [bacterium]|jgi:nicotinate-nucleotide adenylyltransferase|nr:nicotinate-nucleotide adenylyltransferase [candidate division KSB1 bacterium]MDH7560203.1 nicotinate-nucleotide adenylyltransferase [bacterium]